MLKPIQDVRLLKNLILGNYFELIFWDKASIQSKYDFEAINCIFQDICDTTIDFGRKVECFYADFR